jgi:hypothetical protein
MVWCTLEDPFVRGDHPMYPFISVYPPPEANLGVRLSCLMQGGFRSLLACSQLGLPVCWRCSTSSHPLKLEET